MLLKLSLLLLLATHAVAGAAAPTVESLRQWHAREVRVWSITHRILAANLQACPEQRRKNYGFASTIMNAEASPEIRKVWTEAFQLQDAFTVRAVLPGGPAERAGLRVGDAIVAVNDMAWPETENERTQFKQALSEALLQPTLRLTLRRAEMETVVSLAGNDVCDADMFLTNNPGTNAHTWRSRIIVEAGLEAPLQDDAELATVISHEIAHVLLRHTVPERESEVLMRGPRAAMEREADALGIQLMMRAGYDPEGAATALPKLDQRNRGPISRWLGLFGAYMPTPERVEFVRARAADFRANGPSWSPPETIIHKPVLESVPLRN